MQVEGNYFFSGNFAPVSEERDECDLPVTGKIPEGLSGALYRVGPNPQFAPRDNNYHWFAGDGMIHAFFIDEGKVAYSNRWARTPKWQLENQAGKALFGTFGNPATSDPAAFGTSGGTANTNVIWHGGRLLALEESHPAFELDHLTLASKGCQSFGGTMDKRFTAHPKVDSHTGKLHFFAYSPDGPGTCGMLYGVIDGSGELVHLDSFDMPYASMVHDFMVTEKHVLFPVMPLTTSIERAMQGKPLFAWEGDKSSYVGILPHAPSTADMRWFKTDACHVFHCMNAWEEGDTITAYVMQSGVAPGLPNADGAPGDAEKMAARLCRWTFDLKSGNEHFEQVFLDDLTDEFPRIDDRYCGRRNRFGFYTCHADRRIRDEAESVLYGTLACFDFETGRRQLYTLPDGDVISEPVFVPRSQDAEEADGWLLAVACRGKEQRSDLLIFEARHVNDGPIASVHLPCRIPFGFHGNWRPTDRADV
ncbi:carotenoid oxygenase family protein [Undibacterium sp.]|uniref:carotenoid oxygenase family protein n=1 Tax=Undibacterium sp. TaxID=1914977 RepID=UPI00374D5691